MFRNLEKYDTNSIHNQRTQSVPLRPTVLSSIWPTAVVRTYALRTLQTDVVTVESFVIVPKLLLLLKSRLRHSRVFIFHRSEVFLLVTYYVFSDEITLLL